MSSTFMSSPIEGVPGTDASASKRGYYYQDVATALAWVQLQAGQTLYVEVAEDYATELDGRAEVNQVRDIKAPLTLLRILPFLEHVVELLERNSTHALSVVYRTTSRITEEKAPADRPNGIAGLAYWDQVKQGAEPAPLIEILQRLAAPGSRLAKFLDETLAEDITSKLISTVTWATREPTSTILQKKLSDSVAELAHDELNVDWADINQLMPIVINAVTLTSTRKNDGERQLTRPDLVHLLQEATHKSIPYAEYQQLKRDATLARNATVDPLDRDIEQRLLRLRKTRLLLGTDLAGHAKQLANAIREGGQIELGTLRLRSTCLSWCARMLAESDEPLAQTLLLEAKQLSVQPHIELVEALLLSKQDKTAALQRIASRTDGMAQTIRYAIHRRSAIGDGLDWARSASLTPTSFDPDGMYLVLADYLNQHRWQDAIAWIESIPEEASDEYPILCWGIATALLAHAIPKPMQHLALEGPPVFSNLPLSNEPDALKARRRAALLFQRFHAHAMQLDLSDRADDALEFSLWLQLKDRVNTATATADILQRWEQSHHDSRWLPLALTANLPLNKAELAAQIDQRAITYGSLNFLDARARLALILSTPGEEWIDRWEQLKSYIQPYFTEGFLEYYELEALIQTGRIAEARAAAERADQVPALILDRMKIRIEKSGDTAQALEAFRSAMKEDGDEPASLQILIEALIQAGDIPEATIHARSLFASTKAHDDAERWMSLLHKQQRWEEIEAFLNKHPEQVEQSRTLPGLYLDVLLRHGRWEEARKLANERPELTGRRTAMETQLAIYSGNWEKLWEMLEAALNDPALSFDDQRIFAHLATDLGRIPAAKRLTHAVAERCSDDPGILMDCYMLAVRGRWEDDPAIAKWVQSAIAQASDDGPVQSKTLEDIVAMAPEWRERTDSLADGLAKGQMYLSLAAQHVHRPLTSLMLGTAEANRTERDFRRLSPISAFAGISRPPLASPPSVIALDQTALLTLGHLRLLPKVLIGFERIWVPHSIGAWLFAEHQEIQFHQPSLIYEAKTVLDAIAKEQLRIAPQHSETSRELAQRIGRDLAELILAAQVDRQNGTDAYVIRSAPVHLATSLGRANADVSEYYPILRSTRELVHSLQWHGAITEEQAAAHEEYLSRHDTGWNEDSLLPSGATLYLDDLTAKYFHYLDLWEPAQRVFRLFIHPDLRQESAALTELETTTNALDEVIEDIRRFLIEGQQLGKVGFLRQPTHGPDAEGLPEKPKFLLLQTLMQQPGVEAVVVDDRAANGFPSYSHPDGTTVTMRCSLDVLDWLRDRNAIDEKAWFSLRNDLRRSGYVFIPVEARELEAALKNAFVRDQVLVETASARAMRENHLLAQASAFLQFPAEGPWLTNIGMQIAQAVATVWREGDEDGHARAKSDWLVEFGRLDGFVGCMPPPWTEERLILIDAITITRLLANRGIPKKRRQAYNDWLESQYLEQLQLEQPRVFESVCAQMAEQLQAIQTLVTDYQPRLSPQDAMAFSARFCKEQLDELPESIQNRLSADDALLAKIGLSRSSRISIHTVDSSPSFDTEAIYEQAARLYAGESDPWITDVAGAQWKLELTAETEVTCRQSESGRIVSLQHALLVSSDPDARIQNLEQNAHKHGLRRDQLTNWFEDIAAAPLDARRIPELEGDLNDAPIPMMSRIEQLFGSASARVADFAPVSPRYYNRLVLPHGNCTSLSQFAVSMTEREVGPNLVGQANHELLWSSHSSLVPIAAIARMDIDTLRTFCTQMLPSIDLWSLTGLIEAVSHRPNSPTVLLNELREMLTTLHLAVDDEKGRLRLTVALGSLVDGGINTCGLFVQAPVFWRRHASLAHAALLERGAMSLGILPADLATWAWNMVLRFQIATTADLLREPRWSGFLFTEPQLKQELIARVMAALEARRDEFSGNLDDLVFGEHPESLASKRTLYLSALAGPLEGSTQQQQTLPDPLLDQLREALVNTKSPLAGRILTVAHLSGMGGVPDDIWNDLAKAVDQLHQSDVSAEELGPWPSLLMRLAQSAAVSRHGGLASSTLKLIHSRTDIPLGLRVLAGLTACGAHAELQNWTTAVSEFLERCARLDLGKQQAEYLLYVIHTLGQSQPLLRIAVGKILARLQGVAKSIN